MPSNSKEYAATYYKANKEKMLRQVKKWQEEHKEHFATQHQEYNVSHREIQADKARERYYQSLGQHVPVRKFFFYQHFIKSFLKLPVDATSTLFDRFFCATMTQNQFAALSMTMQGTLSQKEIAAKLEINQSSLSRMLNKNIMKILAPMIINHKTKDPDLLKLILQFTLKWKQ